MEPLPAASAPLFKLCFWLCFCSWATLILSLSTTAGVAAAGDLPSNEIDRLSLLAFRDALTADAGVALRSWNATVHHCQWRGVTCSRHHPAGRVTALNLSSFGLISGHISPSVANLTFLRVIDLSSNQFRGSVPPQLGTLSRLRYLNVSDNTLDGEIPSNLSRCSELRILDFSHNRLTGEIPAALGSLPKLTKLGAGFNQITGPIPASLGNLSSGLFQRLWLGDNALTGGIPGELGRLGSLNFLRLEENKLSGTIPASLYNLSNLEVFSVEANGMLSGALPPDLGAIFPRLTHLYVGGNQFQGSIPKSLSNASSLQEIDLSFNLLQGVIPGELGRLRNLTSLNLGANKLSGTIPASLYNLSNLEAFAVEGNGMLSGALPPDLGALFPRLTHLYVAMNQFQGSIPKSLSNASSLQGIDLSFNLLQGVIPDDLGVLQQLDIFTVGFNKLQAREPKHWKFLTSLTNCTKLRRFAITENKLHGELPSSIANFSTALQVLSVHGNQISGSIPPGIGNLVGLTTLVLGRNQFAGGIPSTFGKLGNLSVLVLGETQQLSGEIPSELGNLTRLSQLYLDHSNLSGTIPASMGRLRELQRMDLSVNSLKGSMPEGLFTSPTTLLQLDLSSNHLEGSFPPTVGRLLSMSYLNVSGNRLSGHLPTTIGDWESLAVLDLHGNSFGGTIPASLAKVKGIEVMDLSQNNLTGGIPEFLGDLKYLQYLNLSFNSFTGEVPKGGVFANASAVSLLGNKDVCGGISQLRLPTCAHSSNSHINVLVITIAAVGVFLLLSVLSLVAYFCWRTGKLREGRSTPAAASFEVEAHERISYHDLVKATDGFSDDNLIGRGGSGSVYKGVLDGGRSIAVKVLNVQRRGALKSFKSECEALRNIRHRNLVKIVSVCSSVDFSGNDFKALVFEFFQNGSLERWLHLESREGVRILNFAHRLSISMDVASALDYLHSHGDSPIVHCDLKPSNVLLDDDMVARVGDFGLAKFISGDIINRESQSSTTGIKGSVGYIAPEYGLGSPASTAGDVYSFGILLLELFTTKSPIDDMFRDGLSLQKFVEAALSSDGSMHMVHLLLHAQLISDAAETSHQTAPNNNGIDHPLTSMGECFESLMRIGLNCAKESPDERMTTGDVVKEMRRVQEAFVGVARPTTL